MSSELLKPQAARPDEYLPFLRLTRQPADITECSRDLVVALAAKGFVILTGQSGTGKSRGALELGQGLDDLEQYDNEVQGSSFELVPVGADWTDARPLLGYTNPFGTPRTAATDTVTHVTYEIPDALRLVLRAAAPGATGMPWLLVLDEMNLSHVERYFSPFLSLVEANRSSAGDAFVPLLSSEKTALISEVLQASEPNTPEATAAQELMAAGRGLPVPANLLVVGTVNVDETTYMFSPKVLDRAHVIEMESMQPRSYFAGGTDNEATMPTEAAYRLLEWAIEQRGSRAFDAHPRDIFQVAKDTLDVDDADVDRIQNATQALLDGAYTLLEPVGFGFGFRAVNEVCAYMLCWMKAQTLLNEDNPLNGWQQALDKAFLQKILPKIHGNRRQLGESLLAVESFLAGNDETGTPPAKYRLGAGNTIAITANQRLALETDTPMAKSRAKLKSMHLQLQATGYATFIR